MNKYSPDYTTRFRRNRRLLIKRGYDMAKLETTIDLLLEGSFMPLGRVPTKLLPLFAADYSTLCRWRSLAD